MKTLGLTALAGAAIVALSACSQPNSPSASDQSSAPPLSGSAAPAASSTAPAQAATPASSAAASGAASTGSAVVARPWPHQLHRHSSTDGERG